MNLVIELYAVICSIFIFNSNVEAGDATPHHCCLNSAILSTRRCKDGSNVSLACDGIRILLNPSISSGYKFFIGKEDSNSEDYYLDAYVSGYHVYQPYFCTSDLESYDSNADTSSSLAIICGSSRKLYRDVYVNSTESVQAAKLYRYLFMLRFMLNFASAILLLLTAAIYYALPNVRDVQGTCYFFFTSIAGFGHSILAYVEIFDTDGLLPNMCITNTYFIVYSVLCAMSWSTVTCYHIWRTSMNYRCDNEAELLKRYKMFAFGLPFAFVFSAWAYVHITHVADLTIDIDCLYHQQVVYGMTVSLPVLIMIFLNSLMFMHSQIRIWNMHSIQLQDRKLTAKIFKYRLFMNAKLFFVMGVPWTILMLIYILDNTVEFENDTIITFITYFAIFLVLGEGIPIFLVLVIFRKRVLRSIGNKWFADSKIFPDKWKTIKGSETEEEVSEDETPPKTPEAKFTSRNDDDDNNTPDDSVIVML